MSTQPNWSQSRHCKDCKHFGWWNAGKGGSVWCLHGQYVNSTPAVGCAYWKRWAIYPANAEEPPPIEKAPRPEGLGESDGT